MLYEVITFMKASESRYRGFFQVNTAVKLVIDPHPATAGDGLHVGQPVRAEGLDDLRITSYNVCYTKLLRLSALISTLSVNVLIPAAPNS